MVALSTSEPGGQAKGAEPAAPVERNGYVLLSPADFNAGALLNLRTPPPNQLVEGDCLDVLPFVEANSVDLIFADPPYNLQLRTQDLRRPNNTLVDGVDDHWDQFGSFEEYDRFTERWLAECRRILKPTGSLWVIGSYHNIFRVGRLLQDVGYWILNAVCWIKVNPMPHFRGVRFTNAHETLIWAKKSEGARNITFNYRALKELNGGKQMRSDWYLPDVAEDEVVEDFWRLPICGGAERLRDGQGNKLHSTQKPEALLERVLLATSRPGDLVLDPFAGTGTTGVVAQRLGRRWTMVEREAAYCRLIEGRLARGPQDGPASGSMAGSSATVGERSAGP
jgi:modification methylase